MKCLQRLLVVCCLMTLPYGIVAQANTASNSVYGLDPRLHNGKQYFSISPVGTTGHPFVFRKQFSLGSVLLRGQRYDSVLINVDANKQYLVYKYTNRFGSLQAVVLSDSWLEHVEFEGRKFVYRPDVKTGKPAVYERVELHGLQIYTCWRKDLQYTNIDAIGHYAYGASYVRRYLDLGKGMMRVKSNRGFASKFAKTNRKSIRKYMRNEGVRIAKASNLELFNLLVYCNKLISQRGKG